MSIELMAVIAIALYWPETRNFLIHIVAMGVLCAAMFFVGAILFIFLHG